MAKNNLTPEQDLAVRAFYTLILSNEDLFPGDPVGRRQSVALCRRLLNYIVQEGKHIDPKNLQTHKLGEKANVVDEWEADTKQAEWEFLKKGAKNEANKGTRTRKANRSKSAKGTKVRKAVLPKDV